MGDDFSRLVIHPVSAHVKHIVTLDCTPTQRQLIESFHGLLHAHYGMKHPDVTTRALRRRTPRTGQYDVRRDI
jgi:hypothetical protein